MYVILCDAEKCPWVMASVIKVQNHIFLFVFYSLLLSSAKQVFTFHCRLDLTNTRTSQKMWKSINNENSLRYDFHHLNMPWAFMIKYFYLIINAQPTNNKQPKYNQKASSNNRQPKGNKQQPTTEMQQAITDNLKHIKTMTNFMVLLFRFLNSLNVFHCTFNLILIK